ncbi:MAG: hypothetical protein FJY35_01375 [Betaproteobacteria bacterium]|nr:hypothetical protein [Betaproteobacteria bacterium]
MVIKPRSLEEIAAEQESAVPVVPGAPAAATSGPVASQPDLPPIPPQALPPGATKKPRASQSARGADWFEPPEADNEGSKTAASTSGPSAGEDLWDPYPAPPYDANPMAGGAPLSPPLEDEDAPRRAKVLWVPPEEPSDPVTRLRNWGIALGAVSATVAVIWLGFNLTRLLETEPAKAAIGLFSKVVAPPQPIRVSVTLINECPFHERAFMAKVMPDGPTAEFADGKASLQALPNQRIKLLANARFPDFHYDTGSIPVKPEVTLTANCDSMEERAKAISESLRETFKK